MSKLIARNGDDTTIRAIVFREGDVYIAQCLEFDIAAQASDIDVVLERLDLTLEAEMAIADDSGKKLEDCVGAAPLYYTTLWDNQAFAINRISVAKPVGRKVEAAYAKAA